MAPALAWAFLREGVSGTALAQVFLIFVFPLGLFLAFATPAGLVNDESAHMFRAQALLNGGLIGVRNVSISPDHRRIVSAGVWVDPALLSAGFQGHAVTLQGLAHKSTMDWTHRKMFLQINPIAVYFPVFYIPSAIGIGAAHWLGARPFQAIYAGRLVAYLCYSLIGLLALILARRGRAVIFVALSMPMGLSLAASCTPDGLLTATAALGAALFSRGEWRRAAVCFATIILVKPPYGLLALLFLLPVPPMRLWISARQILLRRVGIIALIILPAALWFGYAMAFVSAPEIAPPYHPGPLWPGDRSVIFYSTDPLAQLRVVQAHPLAVLRLIAEQFWLPGISRWLLEGTIGILNWLTMPLPPSIYGLWIAGAIGAVIADSLVIEAAGPSWRDSFILLIAALVTIILVWLSQYLTWTLVGKAWIDGPCGRYLLPIIPILGLALPRVNIPGANRIKALALCLPALAAFGTLVLLPRWAAIHFYLS